MDSAFALLLLLPFGLLGLGMDLFGTGGSDSGGSAGDHSDQINSAGGEEIVETEVPEPVADGEDTTATSLLLDAAVTGPAEIDDYVEGEVLTIDVSAFQEQPEFSLREVGPDTILTATSPEIDVVDIAILRDFMGMVRIQLMSAPSL